MAEKLPVAFLAGLASVITPCVLPLVPGYLSALSSVEAGRLGDRGTTRRVLVRNDLVGSLAITPMAGNGASGMTLSGRF